MEKKADVKGGSKNVRTTGARFYHHRLTEVIISSCDMMPCLKSLNLFNTLGALAAEEQ